MKSAIAFAGWVIGAAVFTNIAVGLVIIGATLGVIAFVLWVDARHNLRELDRMLAQKARHGFAALDKQRLSSDGA